MSIRVVAAMSGGVDSSVAAALLKEQGYDVIGITLNVWPSENTLKCAKSCCSITDVDDARYVCSKLRIPHYVLNMRDEFQKRVIDPFLSEYLHGRTPNPCIACNEFIKFGALLHKARELGAEYVATGHYAEIVQVPGTDELALKRSADKHKDQTYVLYRLTQRQLRSLLLPCGGFTKDIVRRIAEKFGLPTSHKADSQDICFIGPEGYAAFVQKNCGAPAARGRVVDRDGKVLGTHDGIYQFTVGQRRGLGKYTNKRSYVTAIDARTNTVTLGEDTDLYADTLKVEDVRQMVSGRIRAGAKLGIKIRYSAPEAPATIVRMDGNTLEAVFDTPQRAATPGQAAVFYQEDLVLGGGTIIGK